MAGPWEQYGAKPQAAAPTQTQRLQSMPQNAAKQRLQQAEQALIKSQGHVPPKFYSDKRIQNLRVAAGLPPVRTREEEIRSIARERVRAGKKFESPIGADFDAAMKAGFGEGAFGIPERIGAGVSLLIAPKRLRGKDYNEQLEIERAVGEEQKKRSASGNILGQLVGGGMAGGAAAKGVQAAGTGLIKVGSPLVQRAGKALTAATTLKRGQRVRNAAKIVGAGAAGGAAQALGEGEDVGTGAFYGAGGAAVLGGGAKALGWVSSKVSDLVRATGADSLLRRYAGVSREWLEEAADQFRKNSGGKEPTVYELLPLESRQKFKDVIQRTPGSQRERAARLARQRVEAIPAEMAQVAEEATKPARKAAVQSLASDLAASRKAAAPTSADVKLAVSATRNPSKLKQLRREEARNIMQPFDDRQAFESVDSLLPVSPMQGKKAGQIVYKIDDPEVAKVINASAGLAKLRPEGKGITVGEVTSIIRQLKKQLGNPDTIKSGAAQKAITHIEDLLARDHPDVMPAYLRMNEQFAGKSRQLEGMGETRLQETFKGDLQKSKNIYETPEGGTGRAMGQRLQLRGDLEEATQPALGAVRELAQSPGTARQLRQNIGRGAEEQITEAARTQSESARRLATAIVEQPSNVGEIEAGDLALLASALNPASMAYTKFKATAEIARFLKGIPEGRARVMIDMLFSRDPAMTQRAINALRSSGEEGQQALQGIVQATAAGMLAGGAQGNESVEMPGAVTEQSEVPADEPGPWDEYGGEEPADQGESPYAAELQDIYELEDPEFLDLIERVERQESGGDPAAVSEAGAIGLMQVMPETAPEAAELAGLPWDEEAYYNDPAYQRLLGIAYLREMLDQNGGDVEKALIAYNAGPGNLENILAGNMQMPDETRKYLRAIL